jgi:hypothetical protein
MKLKSINIRKGETDEEEIEQTASEGAIGSNLKRRLDNDIKITLHTLMIILALLAMAAIYAIYGLVQYNSGTIMQAQVCEMQSAKNIYVAKVYGLDDNNYYNVQLTQSDYSKLSKGSTIKIHIVNNTVEKITSGPKRFYITILVLVPILALCAIAKEGLTGKSRNNIKFNDTNDLL